MLHERMVFVKDVEVLSDLKQIKAISQVYRLRILEAFKNQAATAKQISDCLNEPHAKVNYHIKALSKVGILKPAGENVRMGIVEKYYRPSAKNYQIDSGIMKMSDAKVKESVDNASVAMFERAVRQFYDAIEMKDRVVANRIDNFPDMYLTESEAKEFFAELDDLVYAFADAHHEEKADSRRYFGSIMLVLCGK